jgi:uroporphyrin-III C-methyltransferase / precorrin-2 dehydrogenase / sirohydrochlorin ferrochelatase
MLHPVFLDLKDRRVLVVGGGGVAVEKARALADAGASLVVVAPDVRAEMVSLASTIFRRPFQASDVDGAWYVVAAAPPAVNAEVRQAADARQIFVNAVDDRERATAFAASVLRRGPVTMAIGTGGDAPALARLLREALERLLPTDVSSWASLATDLRERWLHDGTPMGERRPQLLAALARLHQDENEGSRAAPTGPVDDRHRDGSRAVRRSAEREGGTALPVASMVGLVSLVGAGPGHPDFLTRRGEQCLSEADLVLYDALVVPDMLALAPRAQCVLVGRRKGRPTLSQEGIHRVMIAAARRGRRVVRLKGGDPFVFGRGGEEALALARADVPFEIVPGVSTAFAAPALASIPVTHRDVSSGVLVVSGHDEERFARQVSGVPADELTVVILMGHSVRARLARRLLDAGWKPMTAVAIVSGASRADADVQCTTLAALSRDEVAPEAIERAPATIVVGDVTRIRHELLNEFEGADRAEVRHG